VSERIKRRLGIPKQFMVLMELKLTKFIALDLIRKFPATFVGG
jgi:hypothetical protein